jgi:glycerol-3-phosphate dehydrogenase (NAD(P)+)
MALQSVGIVGAGAWGTALAVTAKRAGRDVTIWAYEPETLA